MKKHRIVETHSGYNGTYYRVDSRLLFFLWENGRIFNSKDEARDHIKHLELQNNIPKDKVIEYL
jgi:hypothetical protein